MFVLALFVTIHIRLLNIDLLEKPYHNLSGRETFHTHFISCVDSEFEAGKFVMIKSQK